MKRLKHTDKLTIAEIREMLSLLLQPPYRVNITRKSIIGGDTRYEAAIYSSGSSSDKTVATASALEAVINNAQELVRLAEVGQRHEKLMKRSIGETVSECDDPRCYVLLGRAWRKIDKRDRIIAGLKRKLQSYNDHAVLSSLGTVEAIRALVTQAVSDAVCNVRMIPVRGLTSNSKIV